MRNYLFAVLLFGAFSRAFSAEPWALWDTFTGADAQTGLAPKRSSTQNGIDGGAWRLKLAGNAAVNADGSLQTGAAAPARISFGAAVNMGYDRNPFTVVMTVKNLPATLAKPIWHAGNGSNGIGVALAAENGVKGAWANGVWTDAKNNVLVSLPGLTSSAAELTFSGFSSTAGLQLSRIGDGVISPAGGWSGLKSASGLTPDGIYFGNFPGVAAGGLDFTITRVAVYRGAVSAADLPACMADYYTATVNDGDSWENLTWLRGPVSVPTAGLPANAGLILNPAEGAAPTLKVSGAFAEMPVIFGGAIGLDVESGRFAASQNLTLSGLTLRGGASLAVAAGASITLTSAPVFEAGSRLDLSAFYTAATGVYPFPLAWSEGEVSAEAVAALNAGLSGFCSLRLNGGALEVVVDRGIGKLTVMPVGDSITEGESAVASYRRLLWEKLSREGRNVEFTGIRSGIKGTVQTGPWAGHSAWYSARISQRTGNQTAIRMVIDNTLEAVGYPDVIFMLVGVNDLGSFDQADVFPKWKELVEHMAALRPQSKILVGTLLRTRSDNVCHSRTEPYNALIRALFADGAKPFGPNVDLVDLGATVALEYGDFADSIHPNLSGCEKVAEGWLPALSAALEVTGPPQAVQAFNAGDSTVKVRFSQPLAAAPAATLNGEPLGAPVLEDDRTAAYTPAAPLAPRQACEVSVAQFETAIAFTAQGAGAEANIPPALLEGYTPLKTLAIGAADRYAAAVPYSFEAEGVDIASVGRVGYYLELQRPGMPARFVWVSMNNFAATLAQLGVPLPASGNVQKRVAGLQVFANRGVATALEEGVEGFVEFSPYSYGGSASGVIGAPAEILAGTLDWNDTLAANGTYGCMQIHRILPAGSSQAAEVLFAFNRFTWAGDALPVDLGIGSFGTHLNNAGSANGYGIDWTYTGASGMEKMLSSAYAVRRLEIWVKLVDEFTWQGENQGSGGWFAENAWLAEGQPKTYAEGGKTRFDDLSGIAAATVSLNAAAAPAAVEINAASTAYTFSGTGSLATERFALNAGSAGFELPVTLSGGTLGTGTLVLGGAGSSVNASGAEATIRARADVTVGAAYHGNLAVDEGATLTLLGQRGDIGTVGYGKTLSGGGAIVFKSRNDLTAGHPAFNGTLRGEGPYLIIKDANGNAFTDESRPAVDLAPACSLVLGGGYAAAGRALRLRSLTGGGFVSTAWENAEGSRTVDLRLTADSTFGGVFQEASGNRRPALSVSGAGERRRLTLTGASTTLGTLSIGDRADVTLAGAAAWPGSIVVGAGGSLGGSATLTRASDTYHTLVESGGRLNPGLTFAGYPLRLAGGAIVGVGGDPIQTPAGVAVTGSGPVIVEMIGEVPKGQYRVVFTRIGALSAQNFTLNAPDHRLTVENGELRIRRIGGLRIMLL